ncbi:DUF3800 domain-containing protein [Salidesulfovibrio onnuriiensis]|uniref:DUF3800 domain-containing protein n=1 Tax=Salidesulfovibrio onnuriiensis TaxID=2583823 RepID=UPI0011CB0BC3|nr:DUF3800 domain-containing protein [Salidesulfovibrio onnuriiensis]
MVSYWEKRCVFVDEAGDTSIEIGKSGVSNYYVLTAAIFKEEDVEDSENTIRELSEKYFGGAELKSSRIGKNTRRREDILKSIAKFNFSYCSVVVDKSKIFMDSGLRFKKSFYKYINGCLYKQICKPLASVEINSDKHGYKEFMNGFEKYLKRNFENNLIQNLKFNYVDSKDSQCVQMADIISGTYLRVFEGKEDKRILDFLRNKRIYTYSWPPQCFDPLDISKLDGDQFTDQIISDLCLGKALNYINNYSDNSDDDTRLKVETLVYLLDNYKTSSEHSYIYSDMIIEHLSSIGFPEITKRKLMSSVIAELRDVGVIIASNSKGYKIPNSRYDLIEFVKTVENIVVPYLKRLKIARDDVLLASNNTFDVVQEDLFPHLKRYISSEEV